ncbi:MAG: uroporphyrinogen decarboxylase family protein [Promethearchaeota archaeon]
MNSKERIQAALKFTKPDKVPIFDVVSGDLMPLPIIHSKNWKPGWNNGEEGLFPHIRGAYNWDRPDWAKEKPEYQGNNWKKIKHEEIDELGCIWNMKGNDQDMGHPGRASLPKWDDFENYISKYKPDASEKSRYKPALQLWEMMDKDRYFTLLFSCVGPSQVVAAMRGFNNYLIDHRKHPNELKRALQVVADYHVEQMEYSKKYGIKADGIWLVDDLGEQKGPFFSARTFEKFYEDSYRTIIDGAHDLGLDVHLHCCGKIDPLLEPLIKWGLDAIELDSPRMSGYNDLRQYRGKIMFWGCVNIQSIYTQGTPEEVEREVWHMIRNLGTRNGGFGAYFYPTPRDIRAPRKNIRAFKQGLHRFGTYEEIPDHWWDAPISEEWEDNKVPPLPS